jgi:nucleoside-diphosphate-sugar epimerase
MRILVLGSEGQIGSSSVEFLKKQNVEVIEWDITLHASHDLREYNSDLEEMMWTCDFVYYFASDVGGAKYLENHQNSFLFIKNNMEIMTNVFQMLKLTGVPFLFTSSQMAELPFSTYGQLKLLGEKITNDIGGLVVRLWNVYGYEKTCEKSHVITDFVQMAKNTGVIRTRTDGNESRQLLYVENCVEAFWELTKNYHELDKTKNYHITSFEWVKIKEVAEIIKSISGCQVIYGDKQDQTQMNAMNPPDEYIKKYWQPTTSLFDGIQKIYEKSNLYNM